MLIGKGAISFDGGARICGAECAAVPRGRAASRRRRLRRRVRRYESSTDEEGRSISVPSDNREMFERVRAFDWTSTPLGPMDRWSARLRSIVDLMLEDLTRGRRR